MPPTTLSEQDIKAISDSLDEKISPRIKALEDQSTKLDERFTQLSGDLDNDRKSLEDRFKAIEDGNSHVVGAEDAFSKDPDANPATQFNVGRAVDLFWNGWDVDKTSWGVHKDKSLFPERDLCFEATQKAQSAGVDTEGGFAVPQQFNAEMIPSLLARAVLPSMGARIMTDFVGSPVTFPRTDGTGSSNWGAENTTTAETEIELGEVSMTPHRLRSFIPMSNRLLQQSALAFEQFVRNEMERYMSRDLDAGGLVGSGAGSEPVGLKNLVPAPGVVDWGTDPGTTLTKWSGTAQVVTGKLAEFELRLSEDDALFGRPGWIMHPSTRFRFQQFPKDQDGRPILQIGDPNQTPSASFFGYPFRTTTAVAAGTDADLFFGNWEEMVIGQWGTLMFKRTSEGFTAVKKDQTGIMAMVDVDFGFWHSESFANASGLNVSTPPS